MLLASCSIVTCCLGEILSESTFFEPERYVPLIRFDPDIVASKITQIQRQPSDSVLAQQLIFQALTQVLSPLNIGFKFSIEPLPQMSEFKLDAQTTSLQSADLVQMEYRLWLQCHSPKSLECQILAAPLAQVLRSMDLQNFQEAIVDYSRFAARESVQTSSHPDWRLRVDLASPIVRLRSWARWGDVQAITKLLNLALAPEQIQVSAVLKNLTLEIFCTLKNTQPYKFPALKIALNTIAPLLLEFTPQGIQGATIYGVQSPVGGQIEEPPVWMHWLDLPALGDPKFAPTPIILAARGDEDALGFILERLLNPDLEQCLAIGWIDLHLRRRQQLLHIMSEAPICPIQSQVAMTVVRVIRQLRLPGIRGIRVHGRISGQSIDVWAYGVDFDRQPLELPPVTLKRPVPKPPIAKIGWGQRIRDRLVATGIWKPQPTMVKTNQLAYHPRFQWQPSLLLLVVGLGLATISDLAIKFALEARHLTANSPTSLQLSFNNSLLEQKLAQYQLRCLQHGVPDVLVVGSSRALRGINPQVLRRSLIDRGYPNPQIYNFGINGATAQVVDSILRQLLTIQQLPKLVIWADGARAFNSGRIDRTYETIASSERYRQLALMSGVKNDNSSLLQAQSAVQNTYQEIDLAIDRSLAQVSLAYHHRDRLKTWLQTKVPLVKIADSRQEIFRIARTNINERDIDFDGFLALDLQFDPTTYFDKYPKVTGSSDSDYANFQLVGNQDRSLHQTIELLATHKIPLVFVNMPLSDIYLDKFRNQHEFIFKQYMQKLMDSHQLTFIDLDGLINKQYDLFSDPSHLNQYGASEVSKYLAKRKEISW